MHLIDVDVQAVKLVITLLGNIRIQHFEIIEHTLLTLNGIRRILYHLN